MKKRAKNNNYRWIGRLAGLWRGKRDRTLLRRTRGRRNARRSSTSAPGCPWTATIWRTVWRRTFAGLPAIRPSCTFYLQHTTRARMLLYGARIQQIRCRRRRFYTSGSQPFWSCGPHDFVKKNNNKPSRLADWIYITYCTRRIQKWFFL